MAVTMPDRGCVLVDQPPGIVMPRRVGAGSYVALALAVAGVHAAWCPGWVSGLQAPRRRPATSAHHALGYDRMAEEFIEDVGRGRRDAFEDKEFPAQIEVDSREGSENNGEFRRERRLNVRDLKVGMELSGKVVKRSKATGKWVVDVSHQVRGELGRDGSRRPTFVSLIHAHDMQDAVEKGDELTGLRIERLFKGKALVSVPGLDMPTRLEDLEVGMSVPAKVVGYSNKFGVIVDVGAEIEAVVLGPKHQTKEVLQRGDELQGVKIERINDHGIFVSMPGLQTYNRIEDLTLGMTLDGIVSYKDQVSGAVWLDVGCDRDAKLLTPLRDSHKFISKGEELRDMTVEKIEKDFIGVSVDFLPRLIPFEDIKVGMQFDATVVKKGPQGVMVDIGCEKLARVFTPHKEQFQLRWWEELSDVIVESVSKKNGIWVSVRGLPMLTRAEDLKVGSLVDGKVFRTSSQGVFIDIGSTVNAQVLAPKQDAMTLARGQELQDLVVEKVIRLDGEWMIYVSVPGLPKASLIEDLEVGTTVDGTVTRKTWQGIFIDIGCDRKAFAYTPRYQAAEKFGAGQRIDGMKVERVDETAQAVWVSIPGMPEMTPFEELKVGMEVDGKVVRAMKQGIWVDIGSEKDALVLVSTAEALPRIASGDFLRGMTIQKILPQKRMALVSVPGFTQLRLIEDLEVGEVVDGRAIHNKGSILLDIGAESLASVQDGDDTSSLFPGCRVAGLRIEAVDIEDSDIIVSMPDEDGVVANEYEEEHEEQYRERRHGDRRKSRRKESERRYSDTELV